MEARRPSTLSLPVRAARGGALALALALSGQVSVHAQAPAKPAAPPAAEVAKPAGPSWNSLSANQRTALAPLERDWASIDADRKSKWLAIAARFPSMSVGDQQRAQERMAEWSRLSPAQRGQARLQFQEARQLSAEDRQARC
jgi:Protein of unknown function (DUF3106)